MDAWRAGYGANSYVRFGGRSEETGGLKRPYRASPRPYWNLLEGSFTLLLVNSRHIKQVPGRKTNVRDCEWTADLLRAGFVPERPQRELRELTRHRTSLISERAAERNRIQTTLEGAGIKLGDVASDVLGLSGRRMLEAHIGGTSDPAGLADLAVGSLRTKLPQLERALTGQVGGHQRFLLAHQLAHLDSMDELIGRLGQEVADRLGPFQQPVDRLDAVSGIGQRTAEILLAETGTTVDRFPSARTWLRGRASAPATTRAPVSGRAARPANATCGCKRGRSKPPIAAARSKNTYLASQYQHLAARRGQKNAVTAVAHNISRIVWHLLAHDCQ